MRRRLEDPLDGASIDGAKQRRSILGRESVWQLHRDMHAGQLLTVGGAFEFEAQGESRRGQRPLAAEGEGVIAGAAAEGGEEEIEWCGSRAAAAVGVDDETLVCGVDLAAAGKAARTLMGRGVSTIVITLGAKGALIANEQGTCVVPAFEVKPVDSTAAGDIFNGALAVALAEGEPLIAAVRMANAAAALSVMRSGAQPSAPTRQAIDAFMKRGEGADATGDAPMLPASRRRMRSVMSVATATFRRESRVPRPAPWKV